MVFSCTRIAFASEKSLTAPPCSVLIEKLTNALVDTASTPAFVPADMAASVALANDRWKTIEELDIWSKAPSSQIANYSDMAVNLRFGQASLLPVGDGEYLATYWCIEEGQGKILTHRLRVKT